MNAPAVTAVHSKLLPAILRVAQTAMMGALMMLFIPRDTNCMIWFTSLVERVMREAAVNESMSCLDHVEILMNSFSRRFMHRDDAARDASRDVTRASRRDTTAHETMAMPHSAIIGGASPFWRWYVTSAMYSGMRRSRYTVPTIVAMQAAIIAQSRGRKNLSIVASPPLSCRLPGY